MGGEMKKARGIGFITDKKEEYLYTFENDIIYQYKLPEMKILREFQGIPEILKIALSEKGDKLAMTNTYGVVAVIELMGGKQLGQNAMNGTEENFLVFVEEDAHILCADYNGKVMKLDCRDFSVEILYNFNRKDTEDGEIIFFNQDKRINVKKLRENLSCSCFCVSEDAKYFLIAEGNIFGKEKVRVLHLKEQKTIAEWKLRWVDSAKFIRNNQYVLIAANGNVYLKRFAQ